LQFKASVFQSFDICPDTLSVVSLSIMKRKPDRIRNKGNSLLRRAAKVLDTFTDLLLEGYSGLGRMS
jgi:hypothetical protein